MSKLSKSTHHKTTAAKESICLHDQWVKLLYLWRGSLVVTNPQRIIITAPKVAKKISCCRFLMKGIIPPDLNLDSFSLSLNPDLQLGFVVSITSMETLNLNFVNTYVNLDR